MVRSVLSYTEINGGRVERVLVALNLFSGEVFGVWSTGNRTLFLSCFWDTDGEFGGSLVSDGVKR